MAEGDSRITRSNDLDIKWVYKVKYQVSIELSVHLLVYNSDDILVLHTSSCYILLPMHHLYMIRQTLLLATTVVAEPFNRVRGKMLDVREWHWGHHEQIWDVVTAKSAFFQKIWICTLYAYGLIWQYLPYHPTTDALIKDIRSVGLSTSGVPLPCAGFCPTDLVGYECLCS